MSDLPTSPYTEATVELVKRAAWRLWDDPDTRPAMPVYTDDLPRILRAALDALVKAGLLLPEGVETRVEWGSHVSKVAAGQRTITGLLNEMADVLHRLAQASVAHEKVLAMDAVRLAVGDSSTGSDFGGVADQSKDPDHG